MRSMLKSTLYALPLSLSALTIMAVPTLAAQAAIPTEASLLKLVEVTKVIEMMDGMTSDTTMTDRIMQAVLVSTPKDNMNDKQRQNYDAIVSKYSQEIADVVSVQGFNQQIIDIYIDSAKQHFNQQEVDAQIAFYSSEIGQNIIDKQPEMTKDYMTQINTKIMPIVMNNAMQNVQDIMSRMAVEIEALQTQN